MVSTIQFGYGNAARIHRNCLKKECVDLKVLCVMDTNKDKVKQAKSDGFEASNKFEKCELYNPDFYDVCVSNDQHYNITKCVLEVNDSAKILIEKPVCTPKECKNIVELEKLYPKTKISVNENYISSHVTKTVKEKTKQYGFKKPDIKVEFSKNRINDFMSGRFVDQELGAYGYEGSHMLTVVAGSLENNLPHEIIESKLGDLALPDGNVLKEQSYGEIIFKTVNGSKAHHFTSMAGDIKFPIKEFDAPRKIPNGDKTIYRIISLEENDTQIIGQYEPISGYERSIGRVYVLENGEMKEKIENIKDNSMGQHLHECIKYFQGKRDNPSPISDAVTLVEKMHEAIKIARKVA